MVSFRSSFREFIRNLGPVKQKFTKILAVCKINFNSLTLILRYLYLYRYVLKELIETEKHYVVDLGLIVEVKLTVRQLRTHNLR